MNKIFCIFNFLLCILFNYVSSFYIKQKNNFIKKVIKRKNNILKRKLYHLNLKKKKDNLFENRNLIRIEFRPAVGGNEALSWSKELLNTYKTFAEKNKCTVKEVQDICNSLILSSNDNIIINKEGKEISLSLYDLFKNESGIHQVKRVPDNESKDKIHSSTATIAIFIHEDEKIKNEINLKDLKITTFRSSKPGGQNVNKIESGVCILHKPTNIQAECQEERTQELNKKIAMKRLILKIREMKIKENKSLIQNERVKLIKVGNRSERIRTYNFFRGYITDHIKKKKIDLSYFKKCKLEFLLNV
ncbi:peptide chain release factor 1, putative [Plasmodium gallinaceum]|uniref:Peptide chain release factor 1, putative n=1 Tax=Plasmodium gallinaceum TaxID=5849 RepID=A0A1J1GWV9_PLAGA|nr:peptide chain release factor 1, putative [Plasmodium gallinaceum]CRG95789.1 peptide chain release factor 1, putative [Plasmodium gallinaceum]